MPNENVLGYFSRIKNLYMHSTGTADIENEGFGIRLIYQKMLESMDGNQSAELQRLCETEVTLGNVKYSQLVEHVVQASRKVAVLSVTLNALDLQSQNIAQKSLVETNTKGAFTYQETRKCFYCQEEGHISRNCLRKEEDEASQE